MARGRGHTIGLLLALFVLFFWFLQTSVAVEYTVGDEFGWIYGVEGWVEGKNFKAGDVLVFKYKAGQHNVVKLNFTNYDSCVVPEGSKLYQSGNDHLTLDRGDNYYICAIPTHCEAGMRLAAHAS